MATRTIGSVMGLVMLAGLLVGCVGEQTTSVDELIKARLAMDAGQRDVALARLASAIEKNPQLGLAYITRGEILKQTGDYRAAAKDFEQATKLEPYNFSAQYQLGLMYQYLKEFTKSIAAYQKAVEIRPLDPNANMNLAVVYTQTGDAVHGLKYAQAAVNGAPDDPMAHANLASIYSQMGFASLAISEYKRAIELNGKLPDVYLLLANEYLKIGNYDQGRQVLEGAAALANTASVSERLGYAYYKMGRLEKAQAAYEDSLSISPSYYQSMNGLGVISMTRALAKQPADVALAKEALAYWRRSLHVEPNQPAIERLVTKYAGTGEPAAETQSSTAPEGGNGENDANPKAGT
jgi:tetratricopeptide (TPR) repeat protein